jgi:hypothetical protein
VDNLSILEIAMIRRFALLIIVILLATPLAAQAPAGLQMRLDRSTSAADPDDVEDVTVASATDGFLVTTGPAAVVWNPANTASGTYTLRGTFTLQAPSDHVNYYGLVFGGAALEGERQSYLYFLVAQDGTFLVKHRAGDETTHDIVRAEHAAVRVPDATGQSVNALEVRVGESSIDFVVNGTVVHTAPKSGMTARTDGIWGVRVNHRIPGVQVDGLGVTQ